MAKKKKQNHGYIKISVHLDKDVTPEQFEQIVQELDYSIKSKTKGFKVVSTEIVDQSDNFTFSEDDDE